LLILSEESGFIYEMSLFSAIANPL